eukprot:gene7952-16281_t
MEESWTILRCGGGHAAVVYDCIAGDNKVVPERVIIWDDGQSIHTIFNPKLGFQHCRSSDSILELTSVANNPNRIHLSFYICVGDPETRKKLSNEITNIFSNICTIEFPNAIHRTSFISPSSKLGTGNYIGPFAVIHANASVASFCIINTHSVVEHDCVLDDFVNMNPHSVICGNVHINTLSTIGANATIREKLSITSNVMIGMNSTVTKTITESGTWFNNASAQMKTTMPISSIHNDEEVHQIQNTAAVVMADIRWCRKKPFSLERFSQYLDPSIRSGHLTNNGPLQSVLAEKVKKYCNSVKDVVLAASGTAALHALLAAYSLKFEKSLRWATQSFTFPVAFQGPASDSVVLDMDLIHFGPRFEQLDLLKDTFDGVIITNLFGLQCNIQKYQKWCKLHNKLLVFDNAATPIGFISETNECIHDIGDGAIISLHETKPMGRGEGGAIFVCNNMKSHVIRAMNFGFDIIANIRVGHRLCSNWRMSDFAAAAICDHIDNMISEQYIDKHNQLIKCISNKIQYTELKFNINFSFPTLAPCLFIELPSYTMNKVDDICTYLKELQPQVEAKRYYIPLVSRVEVPNAWLLFDR